MNKTIEIIVSPNGEAKLETKGFAGAECREASKFVEQALGTLQNEVRTPELFETLAVETNLRITD